MDTQLQFEWTSVLDKTLEICQEDENYSHYSVREKMLAFTYTFLQTINTNEEKYATLLKNQRFLFLKNTIEGTNSGEIQARPFIANYYNQSVWNAFLSILLFWANDKSENKENTDVMVEKTIHFVFDLLAPNAIDSGLDLIQNFLKLRK